MSPLQHSIISPTLLAGSFIIPSAHHSGSGRLLGPPPASHRGRQSEVSGPPAAEGLGLAVASREEGESGDPLCSSHCTAPLQCQISSGQEKRSRAGPQQLSAITQTPQQEKELN